MVLLKIVLSLHGNQNKKIMGIKVKWVAFENKKYISKSSKYKCVYISEVNGERVYQAALTKYRWSKYCETEREAALAVDLKRIENGEEPINILKRA